MSVLRQRGVASVEVAAMILCALRTANQAVALQELSGLTGLAPSRLHHYMVSLLRTGLAQKDPSTGRYLLGTLALELGLAAADNLSAQHSSAPWLARISTETRESSFFAVPSPHGPLIVRWEQGRMPLTVHARLGTAMPVLRSATGLVWLAFDEFNALPILDKELRRIDPTRRDTVRTQRLAKAEATRREGMAAIHGTMIGNVNALACPVFTRRGQFAGVMTVLGQNDYFDAQPHSQAGELLRYCARAFGDRLP